jgi:hypothetical protein
MKIRSLASSLFLLAALIIVPSAATAKSAASAPAKATRAEAVVTVAFLGKSPFGKRPPALSLVDSETQAEVAVVRAREWTPKSATYSASLPTGHAYRLRFAEQAAPHAFAEVAIAADASGKLMFRIPYAPKPVVVAQAQ